MKFCFGVQILMVGCLLLAISASAEIVNSARPSSANPTTAERNPRLVDVVAGATNRGSNTRAYQTTVGKLMVAEAMFYSKQLGLPGFNPYLTKTNVNPPTLGSLGSIETATHLYSFLGSDQKPITNAVGVEMFLEPGKLAYIIQKDPFSVVKEAVGNDPVAINKWLAELKNRLTTNSAYQLATQWLRSVDVDVDALEQKFPPQVSQLFFYDVPITWKLGEHPPPGTPKKLLPIFDICWGGDPESSPPVWIQIEGVNKGLVHLRMEDTRFSKRRPLPVGPASIRMNPNSAPQRVLQPFNKFDRPQTNHPPIGADSN
jgi:hypothetical protein